MKKYKYVLVNGYTSTGSSAAIDLLKEYMTIYAPDKEFRIIKDPHGVYDLDRTLSKSTDLLNDDIAVREFLWMIHKYALVHKKTGPECLSYNIDFGESFEKISQEYIKSLMDYEYMGYWWYLNFDKPAVTCFVQRVLRKLGLYDFRKHSKMGLFLKSEEEFLEITKAYINRIFITMELPNAIDTVVLDQAIPATYSGMAERYFDDYRVINVERDPRAVYVDLITEEKRNGDIVGHVGFDVASTHNVELFIKWFKKCRQKGIPGKALNIYFEDIILNYEETKEKIERYVGLERTGHTTPFRYLKPEVSKKNVRLWESYEYQDEIKIIESVLGEYLYPGFL